MEILNLIIKLLDSTNNLFFNKPLILGYVLGILSSAAGSLIQYFLERNRTREERLFQYNKDIYFNLQEKTEEILSGIYKYDDYFNKCVSSIVQKEKPLEFFVDKRMEEHYKFKEVTGSYIVLYFPNVGNDFKKFSSLLDRLSKCFMDVLINKKPIEQKHFDVVNEYKRDYDNLKNNLILALKKELDNYSKGIY